LIKNFKQAGNLIYICGITKREMGGSQFFKVSGFKGGDVPVPEPEKSVNLMKKLYKAMKMKIVKSCHDCSDGGFAVCVSEMMIGGKIGAEVEIDKIPSTDNSPETLLFSESQGRFVVEVEEKDKEKFEKVMIGCEISNIGKIINKKVFKVFDGRKKLFEIPVELLDKKWRSGLKW